MSDTRPILIAGPTASGKSGLALRLAEAIGGVIVNADSMQVYRELRILTARPSVEEEARVPHALYGFVPAKESYSAGRYAADVARVLADIQAAGQRAIIVGGTGLYFKALTEGLSPIPPVPEAVRTFWRTRAAAVGAPGMHAELAARDAAMAQRLAPTDMQRIVRALEVLEATGVSLADWQRVPREPVLPLADTIPLRVDIDRAQLYRRIDRRFAAMMDAGAADEVLQLDRLGLDPGLPVCGALGVGPLRRFIAGEVSRETALIEGQTETRQYAKRQITWARSNMIAWRTLSAHEMEMSAEEFASFVQMAH